MNEIHLLAQLTLLILWVYSTYNLFKNRGYIPLNIFGLMLAAGVLMIYVIGTDIIFQYKYSDVIWRRWEWYGAKSLIAIAYIKVANLSRRINLMMNCFAKKDK